MSVDEPAPRPASLRDAKRSDIQRLWIPGDKRRLQLAWAKTVRKLLDGAILLFATLVSY